MKKQFGVALLSASLLAVTGCGFESTENGPIGSTGGDIDSTGIALTIDIVGDTDVAGFRYIIETCAGAPVMSADTDLADLFFPTTLPAFSNAPFAEGSDHLFSDFFTVLSPGCYNVTAQPITASGDESEDCASASANNIIVKPEKTTEILLISQCEGPDVGALDVIAALQHPPEIEAVVYEKFTCVNNAVEICATGSDPNNDPLRFDWSQLTGPTNKLMKTLEVTSSLSDNGSWTECIEVTPAGVGTYEVELVVRDLEYGKYNKLKPAHPDSYTRLVFPIHSADCDPIGGGPDDDEEPKKKKPYNGGGGNAN